MKRRTHLVALFFLTGLILAPRPGPARFDVGEVMGMVSDVDGNRLVEVRIVLSVGEETLEVTTDAKGQFRFRDLKPGNYTIQATHEGYSEANYEPVNIRVGRVTTVQVQMSELLEETIIVTSEPPTASAGPASGRVVIDAAEIGSIPASEDPWSIGARAAGVLSESSSAPTGDTVAFAGHGADGRQSTTTLDGTEVAGQDGAPATAYQASTFSSIEIVTGGSDVTLSTPGTRVDLVTRRGGDRYAAVRGLISDQDWQSAPALSDPDQVDSHRILEVVEIGAEASGPLMREHLWGWASVSSQEIRRQALGGLVEDTRVRGGGAKLDGQLGGNSGVVAYHRGDRDRTGEGAGPDRALETTLLESRPSEVLRIEASHVFNSNLYLTARYSSLDSGTAQVPADGGDGDIVLGADGVWRGSFGTLSYGQESTSWLLDGAALRGHDAGHEVRFGFSHKRARHSTAERWGRDSLLNLTGENFGTSFDIVRLERPVDLEVDQSRIAWWLQDSITLDRVTIDLGVRYDLQRGANAAGRAAANPLFPDLLPALDVAGDDAGIEWSSLSPRLAMAAALGPERRTVVRAGYAIFASRLYPELVSHVSPVAGAEIYLGFEDRDLDDLFDGAEPYFLLAYNGIDPLAAGEPGSPHSMDALLDPERTTEIRLGVDHGLRAGIELGLEHVDRHVTNVLETRRLIRDQTGQVRPAVFWDYELDSVYHGLLPSGEPFSAPVFGLRPGREHTGGSLLLNGGREQRYQASTLSLVRHLAGGWMLRARATLSDSSWRLGDDFVRYDDPTDLVATAGDAGVSLADTSGDVVAPPAAGDRQFFNSRWSFHLGALFQLAPRRPWGFDVGVDLRGREGFPLPYAVPVVEVDGALRELQATASVDSVRLDDVYLLDLRLEKDLRLSALSATVSLDVFNLLDAGYVLERERQLTSPRADLARETLSPRVLRFGLRLALD